jgi:hypothetical protein
VEAVLGEQLGMGVLGVWRVDRSLRQGDEQKQAPAPLELSKPGLDFMPPLPDLQAYDHLLLENRQEPEEEHEF